MFQKQVQTTPDKVDDEKQEQSPNGLAQFHIIYSK